MYYCVRRGKKKKKTRLNKKENKKSVPRLNSMSIITRKDYYYK